MPCYKAKSTHVSAPDTKPGHGANWQTYWTECPCCPPSSSSSNVATGPTSSSSSNVATGPTSSSSSSVGSAQPTAWVLVGGRVPNWNQPLYYEASGTGNAQIPNNLVTNPSGGNYAGLSSLSLSRSWCAPAAAACQLGHLNHHAGTKVNTPAANRAGDQVDAGADTNPAMTTVAWNSNRAWGDYLLDGPTWRGKVGSPDSINNCAQTDFGWWMDTNGSGYISTAGLNGTTLGRVYDGLVKFYNNIGWVNFLGMAYHLPHNGSTLVTMGHNPYSNNSNADETQVWNAIKNEIDNNRTVIATTMGYDITSVHGPVALTGVSGETHGQYYSLGVQNSHTPPQPTIDGQLTNSGEEYTWEVYDANGIGHTILIVGYIEAGSVGDIAPTQLTKPATNWVVVRDNFEQSHRNVILPFNQNLGGAKKLYEILLSTCYVNTGIASLTVPCQASPSSSSGVGANTSSGVSSSSVGGSQTSGADSSSSYASSQSASPLTNNFYYAYPCGTWDAADCATWSTLSGGIPIEVDPAYDSGATISCNQNAGGAIDFKVSKVSNITALGTGTDDCALLVKQATALGGAGWASEVSGAFTTCALCSY